MRNDQSTSAKWIWLDSPRRNQPNQYVQFRREIVLEDAPRTAELRACVDTNFAAWVNGEFVGCGQFSDFPDRRTFSPMDVTAKLKQGTNVIAVLAHYCGIDHFSYLPGEAGLWFDLTIDGQVVAASDERTRCRASAGYRSDQIARISGQRGYTFNYDAGSDDDWTATNYTCGASWQVAAGEAPENRPSPRPVKMLQIRPPVTGAIVAQGLLKRDDHVDLTVAQQMQRGYLSARRSWELFDNFLPNSAPAAFPVRLDPTKLEAADGFYIVIDLGRIECGFPVLELDCTEPCVIDVAFGEHLDDLRVRSHIGGRNFAVRYSARSGLQRFVHYLDRYAARYIQLHVMNVRGAIELRAAGLLPAEYPVKFAGKFECADSLCNKIWRTSVRTLHLCMHEHYEDCPLREQALYANDSRNQMLAGYYAFGETQFARASLELLADSFGPDGYQELCAPMKCPITIPSFTMVWFLAMNDHLMYSGDAQFVSAMLPRMKRVLRRHVETLHDGLLPCPRGKRYWHFYDWAPGLDGHGEQRKLIVLDDLRFDAPLNCFFLLALQAVANMARCTGDEPFAAECEAHVARLRPAIHSAFWDDSAGACRTSGGEPGSAALAELTQALAILAGISDETLRAMLRRKLMSDSNGMTPTTLSQSLYKFEAILLDESCGPWVRDRIIRDWSAMLLAGATAFWETRAGGWDFHHAGSLCHGWSAIPAYFFGAYGLGMRPASPGFERITSRPILGLSDARGIVPTLRGEMHFPPTPTRET